MAEYVVHPDLALALSPRPYLHPVRTLSGLTVTDALPRDHPWHLGVSVGLQHVESPGSEPVNFWGGRTYQRDRGYTWLDDHGRVEHVGWVDQTPSVLEDELAWRVPGQPALLTERRSVAASLVHSSAQAWALHFRFSLQNVTSRPLTLGSPGTHGRANAGYGGFFWRAATSATPARVASPQAQGEDAVHGHPAEWLIFGGSDPGTGRPWSLLLAGEDDRTRADPWFVRAGDYPGVGSALALDRPVVLKPGELLARSLLVVVLDGILEPEAASAVLVAARGR